MHETKQYAVVAHGGVGAAPKDVDGRFNAEMDAAVMDTKGRPGTVAAIELVKNPFLAARDVATTPYVCLALERGIGLFDKEIEVSLIAVSRTGQGVSANRPMPAAGSSHGQD